MKQKVAALLLIGVAACATASEPDFQDEAPVLLEIEYANWAWIPTWKGYYIDSGGALYSWDASDRDPPSQQRSELTHAELMQKLTTKREKLRDLSKDELSDIANRIPAAAAGALTEPIGRCADAGTLVFRAYTFDSQRAVFKPVLLRSEGDLIRENTSGAARAIYEYLDDLDLVQHISGCQPG